MIMKFELKKTYSKVSFSKNCIRDSSKLPFPSDQIRLGKL